MDAVIFDIDGTLLHSVDIDETIFTRAIRSAISDVKIRPLYGDYEHVTDAGIVAQIIRENAVADAEDVVANIKRRFLRMLSEHVTKIGSLSLIHI